MAARDTIAALATANGRGGIAVVRLSGPAATGIAQVLTGKRLRARYAHRATFRAGDGEAIDHGLAIAFPAPNSYTGEDVVELHGHGSPVLVDRLLARVYALGARPARPGEFSERAFLEGKLDLAQAEAVADLIAAGSVAAARAAQRSLDGEFSRRVRQLQSQLEQARVHIEAAIDFTDEEIDFLSDTGLRDRVQSLVARHGELLEAAERGQRLCDGRVVAIIGRPNVGKSSLLNRLAGSERAIVTDIAGTTRDVLREDIRLGSLGLTLIDTAGLRDSDDPVEREGVLRARAELARADHVLLVLDAGADDTSHALLAECPPGVSRTWVLNKIDLAVAGSDRIPKAAQGDPLLRVSARTGAGMKALIAHLGELAGQGAIDGGEFSARARHVDGLRRMGTHLIAAVDRLMNEQAGELAAEELRLAQQTLAELTGDYVPDDLLGAIFSSFCIGK